MPESSVKFQGFGFPKNILEINKCITGYPIDDTQSVGDSKTLQRCTSEAEQEKQHCCPTDFVTPEPQQCFSPSTCEKQLVPLELSVQEPQVWPWRWIKPACSHTRLPKNGGDRMTRAQADACVCCSTSATSPLAIIAHPTLSSWDFVWREADSLYSPFYKDLTELKYSFIFFPIQNPGPVQNQNVFFQFTGFIWSWLLSKEKKTGVPSPYQPAPPCKFEAMCQSQNLQQKSNFRWKDFN